MLRKKKEMERLAGIFSQYIEENESFELLKSKKLNCYFLLELNPYRESVEEITYCHEPENFCRKLSDMIVQDAFALSEFEHDEPDEQEKVEMIRLLGIYMEQLPEYKYLADEVLERDGVAV